MKLSESVLEEGRAFIRGGDLEGFLRWVKAHAPLMSPTFVRSTYQTIFKYDDKEKGLRLFERVFPHYDPAAQMRSGLFIVGVKLLILVGAIGGVVYLVHSCGGLR